MDCKAEAYYFASRLISALDDPQNGDGTKLFEKFLPLFQENYEDQRTSGPVSGIPFST
jgi:hypothetical protein